MIARMWRGWAANEANADLYEEFLRSNFLPATYSIPGFKGEDYEAAHVAARARELLSRFDARCVHSELVIETSPPEAGA